MSYRRQWRVSLGLAVHSRWPWVPAPVLASSVTALACISSHAPFCNVLGLCKKPVSVYPGLGLIINGHSILKW